MLVDKFVISFDVAGSAETAISEDPVDIRIRTAFAPILDPIVDAIYRRPAIAYPTAVAFGTGSPLVRRVL